ncbi:MAG: JAB domain-containing protein [Flavobacteriales bacterium]|nr:JAB domain-containing protein [Flavobacteriales bacterium]
MNNIFAKEVKAIYQDSEFITPSQIRSSKDSAKYLKTVFPVQLDHKEAFVSLYLNRANKVIGYSVISIGGISGTVVDLKLLFQSALICNASAIIMCHNHPSGNLNPSNADINLTNKAVKGGQFLDLPVLDHIILTTNSYYSFADDGLI